MPSYILVTVLGIVNASKLLRPFADKSLAKANAKR
jgi:hypothetical protein